MCTAFGTTHLHIMVYNYNKFRPMRSNITEFNAVKVEVEDRITIVYSFNIKGSYHKNS